MTVFQTRYICQKCGLTDFSMSSSSTPNINIKVPFCSECGTPMSFKEHVDWNADVARRNAEYDKEHGITEQPVQEELPLKPRRTVPQSEPVPQPQEGEDIRMSISVDQRKNRIKSVNIRHEGFKE